MRPGNSFFFQAEDGIRDLTVTGVQTCALPIYAAWDHGSTDGEIYAVIKRGIPPTMMAGWEGRVPDNEIWAIEIGRASCRERVSHSLAAASLKRNTRGVTSSPAGCSSSLQVSIV